MGRAGRDSGLLVQRIELNTASTNVTNSAYVQLDAALNNDSASIKVVNNTAGIVALAIGAASSEQEVLSAGDASDRLSGLLLNKGMRLSIISVDTATISAGFITIELFK